MLFGLLDLNIYMSIPVITKILLIFILDNLSLSKQVKFKLGIGIFSFLFSNMLRIVLEKTCTFDNTNTISLTFKSLFDSFIQYGGAFILPTILKFIPILGMIITILTNLPIIGNLFDFLLWIGGYGLAYWLIHRFDSSSSNTFCRGEMGFMKKTIGVISIIAVIFIEL